MQAQWLAMERAVRDGLSRSAGVSNFCPRCFDECIMKVATITPAVNQLNYHGERVSEGCGAGAGVVGRQAEKRMRHAKIQDTAYKDSFPHLLRG